MPDAIAAGHQNIAGTQLGDEVKVHRRVVLCSQASHQDVGLRVNGSLFFRDLTAIDQSLHIGVVHGAFDETVAVEMVDAGIAGVRPVAVAAGIDQKSRERAVGLFF